MSHKPYLSERLTRTVTVENNGVPEKIFPYFADSELKRAVNLALFLNRPLLLMGEPGCGKSLLAKAVAYEWFGEKMYSGNKYFEWNVKSTSKAREGLYEYDHLLRLRDANDSAADLKNIDRYRRWGPMAQAMRNSSPDAKAVLLIDEIDKADIDFSNDLLTELERNSFYIPETDETVSFEQTAKPFIVITSNGEKDLSDAFLRRCVFHYIDLFSANKVDSDSTRQWLTTIVKARFYDGEETTAPLIERAIRTFVDLRKGMNTDSSSYRKAINTSEFIDWFSVLKACSNEEINNSILQDDQEWKTWLDAASEDNRQVKVPFGNVLFKTTASLFNFKTI